FEALRPICRAPNERPCCNDASIAFDEHYVRAARSDGLQPPRRRKDRPLRRSINKFVIARANAAQSELTPGFVSTAWNRYSYAGDEYVRTSKPSADAIE